MPLSQRELGIIQRTRADSLGMLAGLDTSKMFDTRKMLAGLDTSKMFSQAFVDNTKMLAGLDTSKMFSQAFVGLDATKFLRGSLLGAHTTVMTSYLASLQSAIGLGVHAGALAAIPSMLADEVSDDQFQTAAEDGLTFLEHWRSWYIGLPRGAQAFVVVQLLWLWTVAWCLLIKALAGADSGDATTSCEVTRDIVQVAGVISGLWMVAEQFPPRR